MKILILGATGNLGRHITASALRAGHEVTAFARRPEILGITHDQLAHFKGDAYDPDSVLRAVEGHDAVVIALGTGKSRKNTLRSVGTRNVIAAMEHHGVSRLICQTTLGCHETWDQLNFFWKRIMFGAMIRPVFKDHELQERMTQASELDWTIVRPSAFSDEPGSGDLLIGFPPTLRGLEFTVAKSEVADFIIDEIDNSSYLREPVSLSR